MSLSPKNEEILQSLISMAKRGNLVGAFDDIPSVVYNDPRMPGVRSGLIKSIVEKSYNHYLYEGVKNERALFFGSAFHAYVTDFEEFTTEYKKDLSSEEIKKIGLMHKKLIEHPDVKPRLQNAKFEVTFFSQCQVTGLLKRCRVDLLQKDLSTLEELNDFKTCKSASPSAFGKDARFFLYRISAAYYLGIVSEVLGRYVRNFNLIPSEKEEPYESAVYRIDDKSIAKGEEEALKGLKILKEIYQSGDSAWKGYELGVRDLVI
jgi:hypothetical protein